MLNRQTFQHHQFAFGFLILFSFLLINNSINAITEIMELYRGKEQATRYWEPFVWEYTSAVSSIMLFPLIISLLRVAPFSQMSLSKILLIYMLAPILYSLAHVLIMVVLRESIYWLVGGNYDFGHWQFEIFYELQKDVWSFYFWVIAYLGYQFIVSRWLGEASPIEQAEAQSEPETISQGQLDRLIVKKLGKEFIINTADIQWLESAGNYVNLYINERIYPMRITLSALVEQLAHHGICRVHRSYALNVNQIVSISSQASGDSDVLLKCGKSLKLSRRYKDKFREHIEGAVFTAL